MSTPPHDARGLIVTLTPNPSIDRTVALAGPLRPRCACSAPPRRSPRPAARASTSPAPACPPASRPSPCCPPPTTTRSSLELAAAGIAHRLAPADGPVRVNLTISEPDGTTTKLNSPGATASPATLDALAAAAARRWPTRPTGSCSPARCRPAPPTAGTPTSSPRCARPPPPGSPSTPATRRCVALVDRLGPRHRPAPDEAQRRGARLLHRRRRRRHRGRPRRRGRRGPHPASTAASARCWPPSAATARCSSPPTAPGTPPRRPPTSSAPSVPATPASSATCSAACAGQDPADRLALAVAYGSAAAGLPGTTIPQPTQVRPDLVVVRALALDHLESDPMTDLITADLVRLDADLGADKHDAIRALAAVVGVRRAGDRRRPHRRGRPGPRGQVGHRPQGRHRDPALPHRRRRHARRWSSRGSRRPSTSAPRTAPPTWRS